MMSRFDPSGLSRVDIQPLSASARWLVLIVFLALAGYLLLLGDLLLQDPDTWWHITVGGRIWHGGMPVVDEYSHTFAGQPWIAKEWLGQVLLFLAHDLAGWRGIVLLTATAWSASFALLLVFLLRRLKGTIALALMLLTILPLSGQIVARPSMFFPLLLILWFGSLVGAVERGRPPPWSLVPLMAIWANLHASFPVAFALAGLVGLEAIATARQADRLRVAVRWGVFGIAALAATGATPYGFGALRVAVEFASFNEGLPYISEWQPPRLDAVGLTSAALALAALLVVAPPGGQFPRMPPVLVAAWMAAKHARFTGLLVIVSVLAIAGPLARRLPALAARPQSSPPARAIPFLAAALASVVIVLAVLIRPAPSADTTPDVALNAALAAGVRGRVFNEYDFGGYLIFRGIPTFTDGRNDQIYRGGFTVAYFEAQRAADEAPMRAIVDRYNVDWAIVRTGSMAATQFERLGWTRLHADDVATVFLRP